MIKTDSGNEIVIAQNRLFTLYLYAYNGDQLLQLADGEKFVFGVKKRATDTNYVIKRDITSERLSPARDKYVVSFSATETNIPAGRYVYDVLYKNASGKFYKVIGLSPLVVEESVTKSGDVT